MEKVEAKEQAEDEAKEQVEAEYEAEAIEQEEAIDQAEAIEKDEAEADAAEQAEYEAVMEAMEQVGSEAEWREVVLLETNPYRNRICRRRQYREEVGRQRNSWIRGVWKWKKR